jgi:hypothetical protein
MKEPKEKAIELVDKFWDELEIGFINSKKCALIAVEFAKENPLNTDGYNKYLQEVKEEIEKL